jgi:hypothetical protein
MIIWTADGAIEIIGGAHGPDGDSMVLAARASWITDHFPNAKVTWHEKASQPYRAHVSTHEIYTMLGQQLHAPRLDANAPALRDKGFADLTKYVGHALGDLARTRLQPRLPMGPTRPDKKAQPTFNSRPISTTH